MKRTLLAALALLTTTAVFTACGDSTAAPVETNAPSTATAVTDTAAPSEPTNGDLVAEQVGDVDFGGYEIRNHF